MLYGIKRSPQLLEQIELIEDRPAVIAELLIKGEIDLGLVPVAAIPKLKEWHIVADHCIGATSAVASVCIFSEVPMEQIEKVLLDDQSRTSVNLARILLKEYWKKNVEFIPAYEHYQLDIKGTTAGVVIGDRALQQRSHSPYIYDLAEAWIGHTGLPFVFAAWISNKQLPKAFIEAFNKANAIGFEHLEEVIAENPYEVYDLYTYYTQNISYELTEEKRKGMELFLQKISDISL